MCVIAGQHSLVCRFFWFDLAHNLVRLTRAAQLVLGMMHDLIASWLLCCQRLATVD
jgi:hypothetical protein